MLYPDFEEFIESLNAHRVRYLIIGGYAVALCDCNPETTPKNRPSHGGSDSGHLATPEPSRSVAVAGAPAHSRLAQERWQNLPAKVVDECPESKPKYSISITGDGPPQILAAGAAVIPLKFRNCQPSAYHAYTGLVVSACSEASNHLRSCIWCSEKNGMYLDRNGTTWNLTVVSRRITENATAVTGDITAIGESKASSKKLRLLVRANVGRDVAAIAAPDIYPRTAWSDE